MFLLFCIIEHGNIIFPWSKLLQLNLRLIFLQKLLKILECVLIPGPFLFCLLSPPPAAFRPCRGAWGAGSRTWGVLSWSEMPRGPERPAKPHQALWGLLSDFVMPLPFLGFRVPPGEWV